MDHMLGRITWSVSTDLRPGLSMGGALILLMNENGMGTTKGVCDLCLRNYKNGY